MTKLHRDIIRIILADDHRRVHQVITEMISYFDDIEILAHASNGAEAVKLCTEYQPDLVLMDILMPGMDGIEATRHILAAQPHTRIIALSSFKDDDTIRTILEAGAVGFILKDAPVEDLANVIRTAYDGQSIISPEIMSKLLKSPTQTPADDISLTARELEVLRLFADGRNNPEIGASLNISVSTVKFHINNILEKFEVETRAEALVLAAKHGLV